jgi:hypothetical protein
LGGTVIGSIAQVHENDVLFSNVSIGLSIDQCRSYCSGNKRLQSMLQERKSNHFMKANNTVDNNNNTVGNNLDNNLDNNLERNLESNDNDSSSCSTISLTICEEEYIKIALDIIQEIKTPATRTRTKKKQL